MGLCRLCAVGTFQMRVCSWVTWEWEPQPHTLLAPRSCWLWQQEVWSLELGHGEAELDGWLSW